MSVVFSTEIRLDLPAVLRDLIEADGVIANVENRQLLELGVLGQGRESLVRLIATPQLQIAQPAEGPARRPAAHCRKGGASKKNWVTNVASSPS